ncbi:MAG: hypothetical protein R2838_09695 [Caldilineaceae bacterium]
MINLLNVTEAPDLVNPAQVAGQDAGVRAVFTLQVDDVDVMCRAAARGVVLLNGHMDRPGASARPALPIPAVTSGRLPIELPRG